MTERGLKEGLEKGLKQGIEQGIERGIEQAKLEDARNMINYGLDDDIIVKCTGLERKVIEKLKEEV